MILFLLIVVALGLIIVFSFKEDKQIVLLSVLLLVISVCVTPMEIMSHGATIENIIANPMEETIYHYFNSPVDQSEYAEEQFELNNLDDTILVFYRFDCPDCTASYKEIDNILNNSGKRVIWVQSNTNWGSILKDEYGVKWVPSVIICGEENRYIECNERIEQDGETTVVLTQEFKEYFGID